MKINENPNNTEAGAIAVRKGFYDLLTENISIEGIIGAAQYLFCSY